MEIKHLLSSIDSIFPTGACVFALDDDCAPIASLGLRLREPGGFINSLFVAESHRRQGIAERLVRYAAGLCLQHGKETLGLTVAWDNKGAQALYRKLGFRPYGVGKSAEYQEWVAVLPLNE